MGGLWIGRVGVCGVKMVESRSLYKCGGDLKSEPKNTNFKEKLVNLQITTSSQCLRYNVGLCTNLLVGELLN